MNIRNRSRRSLGVSPGAVTVGAVTVPLPSGQERRANRHLSLGQILADGDAEHHGGCHGGDCDGHCAEVTYARWSAAGWR